jgi:isopentenyl-diphosphate Delta-isomerase
MNTDPMIGEQVMMIPGKAEDGGLFPIEKMDAHRRAVPHLAVSIFVFDGKAMLLQRRAQTKYHCGGLWANTCCTHPHWGESLESAASRRLVEELGFTLPLTPGRAVEYRADVGNGLTEHEHVTFYFGWANRKALLIRPDPSEVMETRWATWDELAAEIAADPAQFTPWFRIYMERFPGFAL